VKKRLVLVVVAMKSSRENVTLRTDQLLFPQSEDLPTLQTQYWALLHPRHQLQSCAKKAQKRSTEDFDCLRLLSVLHEKRSMKLLFHWQKYLKKNY